MDGKMRRAVRDREKETNTHK